MALARIIDGSESDGTRCRRDDEMMSSARAVIAGLKRLAAGQLAANGYPKTCDDAIGWAAKPMQDNDFVHPEELYDMCTSHGR
jgi:hypothetical protein